MKFVSLWSRIGVVPLAFTGFRLIEIVAFNAFLSPVMAIDRGVATVVFSVVFWSLFVALGLASLWVAVMWWRRKRRALLLGAVVFLSCSMLLGWVDPQLPYAALAGIGAVLFVSVIAVPSVRREFS